MVSATLRGAFGLKTKQELTKAEIRSILQETEGELEKIWLEIEILEKDAPQTNDVKEDIKNLVQNHRSLTFYTVEMLTMNDQVTVKSDLSVLKNDRETAKELRDNASSLRKDVANTSKRVHKLSSRLELNVVNRTNVASGAITEDSNVAPSSSGSSNVFQTILNICIPPKKRNKKGSSNHSISTAASQQPLNATDPSRASSSTQVDSEQHSVSTSASQQPLNATDLSRFSSNPHLDSDHSSISTATTQQSLNATDLSKFPSDSQLDSDSSVDGYSVLVRDGKTYRIRAGCQTSKGGTISFTGQNQAELGMALDEILEGRAVESQMAGSQMQTILESVARRNSVGNISVDNMSLDSVYIDAPDGLAAEELV
ncbi:hypothetical protein BDV93DRAFT_611956 [Ceratobasidium sp. AG-I]|nr:hypothetical protein BDV93DRAFT_611956 [Ceratobasidium sp. AG-I]